LQIPEDLDDLFLKTSLYVSYDYTKDEIERMYDFLFFARKLDCYCIQCEKESTFISDKLTSAYQNENWAKINQLESLISFNRYFKCSRDNSHFIVFIFDFTDGVITKIGQNPSIADISNAEIKKYHSLLGNEKYRELSKAVGLSSHGIGIGSFVYLRRIFEELIEEAHNKSKVIHGWSEEIYSKSRMAEKIDMLQDELPQFLVENKGLYSVLSKGIHELSEDECLEMFPAIKLGIELILDEKLEQRARQNKIALSAKSISSFVSKIKS
jgi:hypothetical protein